VKYRVTHTTEYRYEGGEVSSSYSVGHLVPRRLAHQACLSSDLVIDPVPLDYRERFDFFDNRTSFFSIHEPHRSLRVTATSEVDVTAPAGQLPFQGSEPWDGFAERLRTDPHPDLVSARQYLLDSPLVAASAELRAYAEPSFPLGRPLVEAVVDLTSRIHREFDYEPGSTKITTGLSEVLERRQGVCQDFAHLTIGALRSLGLAARYVSGYLETLPPPGKPKLVGADASHAWLSVFIPSAGWLDLDPTNDRVPNERYITTAWGRDYADVTPLKGVVFSSAKKQKLDVSVDVARLEPVS
jgi:transglutaminase-like putative cysteine protease